MMATDMERELAWALSRWSLAVQFGIVFFLAAIFFVTWLASHRRILRTWSLAWASDALGLGALFALALFLQDDAPVLSRRIYAVYGGLKVLYASLLVLGLQQYRRLSWAMQPAREPMLLAGAAAWSLTLSVLVTRPVQMQTLTYLAVAVILAFGGGSSLRRHVEIGERVAGFVFLLESAVFLHHGLVLLPTFLGGTVPAYMSRISFVDTVVEFLVGLGCILALGLRIVDEVQVANRQLEERERILRTMVETDALTGLANRRALRSYMTDTRSAMVFFIDIDRFKEVNDAWGHATGDRLLVRVADALRSVFRAEDGLFRVGGDEFLAVVPGLDPEAATDRARRLRETLATHDTGSPPVSVSIGIAPLDGDHTLDRAIAAADEAMYADKARIR